MSTKTDTDRCIGDSDVAPSTYRTSIPKPDATFFDDTNVLNETLDKIREIGWAEESVDTIQVDLQAHDDYELAVMVRDLQDDLNSSGFYTGSVHIERPAKVQP